MTHSWRPLPWKREVEIVVRNGGLGQTEVSIFSVVFAPRICWGKEAQLRHGSGGPGDSGIITVTESL